MIRIFDVHSHILPGIDDGAENIEVSLEMAKRAIVNNIREMIVTPHFSFKYNCLEDIEVLKNEYYKFKTELKKNNIPLKLFFGLEILYSDELLEYLKTEAFFGLNETKYLLIEFDFKVSGELIIMALAKIKALGYFPILAHPERYHAIWNNFDVIVCLAEEDILFQCNCGSLIGHFGYRAEKVVKEMLRFGYVNMFGSDCHDLEIRNLEILDVYYYLESLYGIDYCKKVFYSNAKELLLEK